MCAGSLDNPAKPAKMEENMGAEEPLVGSPVFKTGGDGAPVLVCSIRTRPRQYPDRRGMAAPVRLSKNLP